MGKILAICVVCVCIACAIIAVFYDINALCSFVVGFLGFVCVIFGSMFALVKKLKQAKETSQNANLDSSFNAESSAQNAQDMQDDKATTKDTSFSQRFVIGAQISLSLLRMLSYVGFGALVIILLEYKLFVLGWFFIGLLCGLVVALIGGFMATKANML